MTGGWLTNDPKAAKLLRAADSAFLKAEAAARSLPLQEKIAAYRSAKAAREAAHTKILEEGR